MAFMKNLAKGGLFGAAGLAATAGKKKTPPIAMNAKPSLITEGSLTPAVPSLISSKSIY